LLRAKRKGSVEIAEDMQALWVQVCEAANVLPGKERPVPMG
jgi:hypothetical protein